MEESFTVQVGKGRGKYSARYGGFKTLQEALLWYDALNIHSGYKKRIVRGSDGKVMKRYLS